MTPAKVLRSSPLIFRAELWQGMQLAWNMGSTLVSKVALLSRFSGVDWAKTSAEWRTRMRHTAHRREIKKRIPTDIYDNSASLLPAPYCMFYFFHYGVLLRGTRRLRRSDWSTLRG